MRDSTKESSARREKSIDRAAYIPGHDCSFTAFNTQCTARVYTPTNPVSAFDALKAACRRFEYLFSHTLPTSSLSRLNQAHGKPVEVEPELAELIRVALHYGERTGGLFDITMGPVVALWNAARRPQERGAAVVPAREDLAEACTHVDYRRVHVDGNVVMLEDPESSLVFGGIAKGYIADALVKLLQRQGIHHGFVNLGGNVKVFGGKPQTPSLEDPRAHAQEAPSKRNASVPFPHADDHTHDAHAHMQTPRETLPFSVGIREPIRGAAAQGYFDTVELLDGAVVTSGIYERGVTTADGTFYHHILDPRTGMPVDTDLLSATLITETALEADGYTTALIAMGLDRACTFVENLPGCQAVFVTREGVIYRVNS